MVMGKLLAEYSCVFALNLLYLSGRAIVPTSAIININNESD